MRLGGGGVGGRRGWTKTIVFHFLKLVFLSLASRLWVFWIIKTCSRLQAFIRLILKNLYVLSLLENCWRPGALVTLVGLRLSTVTL